MSKDDYAVGYGKPPKHGQFRKGVSGNPKGRGNRLPTLEELIDQELRRKIYITEDGRRKRVIVLAAIAKRFTSQALAGDLPAAKFVKSSRSTADTADGANEELSFTEEEILAAIQDLASEKDQ